MSQDEPVFPAASQNRHTLFVQPEADGICGTFPGFSERGDAGRWLLLPFTSWVPEQMWKPNVEPGVRALDFSTPKYVDVQPPAWILWKQQNNITERCPTRGQILRMFTCKYAPELALPGMVPKYTHKLPVTQDDEYVCE